MEVILKDAVVKSWSTSADSEGEDAFQFTSGGGEEVDAQEWSLVHETIQRDAAVREVVPDGFRQTFPPHIVVDPAPASGDAPVEEVEIVFHNVDWG